MALFSDSKQDMKNLGEEISKKFSGVFPGMKIAIRDDGDFFRGGSYTLHISGLSEKEKLALNGALLENHAMVNFQNESLQILPGDNSTLIKSLAAIKEDCGERLALADRTRPSIAAARHPGSMKNMGPALANAGQTVKGKSPAPTHSI